MRPYSSFALAAVLASSCAGTTGIHTGDLLFVGIPADSDLGGISEAIAQATGDGKLNFIHTAILEVDGSGRVWVVDATTTRGVARYPLEEFLVDFSMPEGKSPVFDVMRLKDDSGAASFVENAKKFIGEDYDHSFYPQNDSHYCTELVYDAYVRDGVHVFDANPMNFKDSNGEYPEYWQKSFQKLGIPVPQGVPGTNPQDMHASDCLVHVDIDMKNL